MKMNELIIYACPLGEFNTQLETYFTLAKQNFHHNPAHDYMPHVTLTGFFRDVATTIPHYQQALSEAYETICDQHSPASIEVSHLLLGDNFHGYEISSDWLQELIQQFASKADTPTRTEAIRPKSWLHLSLGYRFPPEEHEPLRQLALTTLAPIEEQAFVWELRFYERLADKSWRCHATWPL